MEDENNLIAERLRKLKELKGRGVNPYPYSFDKKHSCKFLNENFSKLKAEEQSKTVIKTAGRIMNLRNLGKVIFGNIIDDEATIQFYMRKDDLKETFQYTKLLDIGDFIGLEGFIFRTKKKELTVYVKKFEILSKSLRPLPEKYHGLKDTEIRYRKRYLDLIMNSDVKKTFIIRSKVITAMREFLNKEGFLEVETPTLQPIYGGANARPFITRHNTLNMDLYLRISNELYLKRLIVGGFEKVYEFVKDFRNEGIDTSHNPEFTQVEWYAAYEDYNQQMDRFEKIIEYAAKKATGKTKFEFDGHKIELKRPWKRLTMNEAIKKYAKLDVEKLSREELIKFLEKEKKEFNPKFSKGELIITIFEEFCEDKLIQPTFIYNMPREATPLCKSLRNNNNAYNEQFEPYIAGMEMGNAYSELNDPILQSKHFKEQEKKGRAGAEEFQPMDSDFVEAMEYGMPPTGGVGIGVDRIVMIISEQPSIRDVILFPTMKPKKE